MKFDYFYGNEAEQFTFYRIPKVLITSPQFKRVSDSAKLLYGLMLDRMGLSIKNGWFDEQGRAYIFYKLEDIMLDMNCCHTTVCKLFAELDVKKGIGLIECVKQGQGNPQKIYLKKFVNTDSSQTYSRLPKSESQDFQILNFKTSKTQTSRLPKNESQDFQDLTPNNTKLNNTEFSDTYPITSHQGNTKDTIGYDEVEAYRKLIKENIEYDILVQKLKFDVELIDNIVNIITDSICTSKPKLTVGSESRDAETVKSQLLKLNSEHIEYVIECLKSNTSDVGNPKQYILTALYNAPDTMSSYYALKVGHDMRGG